MEVRLLSHTRINLALTPADDLGDVAMLLKTGQTHKQAGTAQERLAEFAARVCYRSTDKMGRNPTFVQARVREGHEDIIEHVTFVISVTGGADTQGADTQGADTQGADTQVDTTNPLEADGPVRWRLVNRHLEVTPWEGGWVVSGNARVWLDLFRRGLALDVLPLLRPIAPTIYAEFDADQVADTLSGTGTLSGTLCQAPGLASNGGLRTGDQGLRTEDRELRTRDRGPRTGVTLLAYTQPLITEPAPWPGGQPVLCRTGTGDRLAADHNTATFLIEGVSRTCTHQIARHRLASISQESQRYCQFGNLPSTLEPEPPPLPSAEGEKRPKVRLFTINQERFIAEQYQAGFSCEKLAAAYDVHPTTIRDILLRNGVKIRSMRDAKTVHIDTDFFREIDTPLKAYVLGLIYSDGNVARRGNEFSHASITQHSDYVYWLRRLAMLWGGHVVSGGRENTVRATIPGKTVAEYLVRHGVLPAKSRILEPPQIPEHLASHFIRGYVDGDGHIGRYPEHPVLNVLGTQSVLEWIVWHVNKALDIEPGPGIRRRWTISSVDYGGRFQVPKILDWIYEGFDFRYSHPKRLERACQWSEHINQVFQQQLTEWGRQYQMILPPKLTPLSASIYVGALEAAAQEYANLRALGIRKEDARFLLPGAAETRLVITMNFRAWAHFCRLRCDKAAQWEIRAVAYDILRQLYGLAPGTFQELYDAFLADTAVG